MASILKVENIEHTNGTAGLQIASNGIITQSALPLFMVDLTADQTGITDNVETRINFNNVVFDTDSGWDNTNYRYTVDDNSKGYYFVTVDIYCNTVGGNTEGASLYLRKNGTKIISNIGKARVIGSVSTTEVFFSVSGILDLTTSGDYYDVSIQSDVASGGTTTVNRSDSRYRTYTTGFRLR